MSTAEIKMLIKECIETNSIYTTEEISEFIKTKSKKEFTSSQLSSTLTLLSNSGDIVKVDRGLYKGKDSVEQNINNRPDLKKEAIRKLNSMEGILADFVNSIKVWDLEEEDLEILLIFKELKNRMENARKKCEQ